MGPELPIYQATVVRPRSADDTPKRDALQIVLYYRPGSAILPEEQGGIQVELSFADGESEAWREQRRQLQGGHILTLHLAPIRIHHPGSDLVTTGANPRVVRVLTGFNVRIPDADDLRFIRENHPESTRFLPVK